MDSEKGSRLILDARAGSTEALNAVFERHADRLLALVRLRLGPQLRRRLEAQDIVQATLLKAFLGIHRFEGSDSGSLMAWLAAIAVDEIRDQTKFHGREKRDLSRDTSIDDETSLLADEITSQVSRLQLRDDSRLLERVLEELEDDHREVILLRSFEELTFPEIAERMGRSPDACRMLYGRAMFAVTERMKRARGRGRED